MNVCKLVIKEDSKNSINKKILSYINKNMETLIFDKQLIFEFHCIKKKQKYQGISKCPALVVNKNRYTGDEILEFLRKPNNVPSRRRQNLNPKAELGNYYDSMILSFDDVEQDVSELHQQKLNEMMQLRAPQNDKKNGRIPCKYDSIIGRISANQPIREAEVVDDFGVDEDFSNDYDTGADFGSGPSGDFNDYAKTLIGGGNSIIMA